jgi:hypothetical protein
VIWLRAASAKRVNLTVCAEGAQAGAIPDEQCAQDWADIEHVLAALALEGRALDWPYVEHWCAEGTFLSERRVRGAFNREATPMMCRAVRRPVRLSRPPQSTSQE